MKLPASSKPCLKRPRVPIYRTINRACNRNSRASLARRVYILLPKATGNESYGTGSWFHIVLAGPCRAAEELLFLQPDGMGNAQGPTRRAKGI
eukprot:7887166-Pyramimonas_sp.AAC.2